MSAQVKYITYDNGMYPDFIIFGGSTDHSQMAFKLNILPEDIIGAGFCVISDDRIKPYGKSFSLKKETSLDDERILNKEFED